MLGLFKNISLTELLIIVCSTLLLSLILAVIIGFGCAPLFALESPCPLVIILFYVITVLLSIILK